MSPGLPRLADRSNGPMKIGVDAGHLEDLLNRPHAVGVLNLATSVVSRFA